MTEEYTIPIQSSGTVVLWTGTIKSPMKEYKTIQSLLEKPEKADVSNKEIEKLLKGLMLAFENSATGNYGVKKAKTSLTVTKSADGKLEVSLGLGIFKLLDAEGKLKGEVSQGIEIEIERRENKT